MTALKAFVAGAVLAASGLSALPAAAQDRTGYTGPSFDCAAARKRVEKMICASRSLSAKDAELAAVYSSFIKQYRAGGGEGSDISPFEAEQRAWTAQRNRCRASACLHAAYDKRIKALDIDY